MNGREPIDETVWVAWVEYVAVALEADVSGVSPRAVHGLTGRAAAHHRRLVAPISAYLWGLATTIHLDRDPGELAWVVLGALPES